MLAERMKRYVPVAAWVTVAFTLLAIPARVLSYGYLPMDDALRHAAKAVCGKPWAEILVLRSDFTLDPHPGWHTILGWIYQWQHCGAETLVVVAIFGLALLFGLVVLPWLRWPEAWLAALLAAAVFSPLFLLRWMNGRPLLFTMAVLLALLCVWSRLGEKAPGWREALVTIVLLAAAAWIHGSFYLLILPAIALLLAGRWRQAFWFGACWLVGSFLGASLTGHPIQFLLQSLRVMSGAFGGPVLARQLVDEFQPSEGDPPLVLAVLAMMLWRSRSADWKPADLLNPILVMGIVGWVLGLAVRRFWLDWGLPAILLWLALELEKQFKSRLAPDAPKRLLITSGLAFGLFVATTSDTNSRWTWNLTNEYLIQDDPALAGWLPEPQGIIYSADERVFYETFFKNPNAPWRYVLGFEAALMPPDDLAVMRKVYWNHGDVRAYEPWVRKMRPSDRLVIRASWLGSAGPARLPELEWRLAVRDLWVGRPRPPAANPPAAPLR